ncbi:hypothetical protein EDC04DRAFT_771646 [Pisolithus marmoratus]|nr:hypothetical protein EDC04DRAFT_771646 [Pisolithus marmoratus]
MQDSMAMFLRGDFSAIGNIPTIVVFTKYDRLLARGLQMSNLTTDAEKYLEDHCNKPIEQLTGSTNLTYVAVSCNGGEHRQGLENLIELTYKKITATFGSRLGMPSSVSMVIQMAQRVSPSLKIEGSITVGKWRYWRAPTDYTVPECIAAIHTDIVRIWNLDDPSQHLSSEEFREIMANLIGTIDVSTPPFLGFLHLATTIAMVESLPVVLPLATGRVLIKQVYGALDVRHKFMAYIVHLVHILEMLFALQANNSEDLTRGAISSAFNAYCQSETFHGVDMQIGDFDNKIPRRDTVLGKIISLIRESPTADASNIGVLASISREDLERDEWYIDDGASERRIDDLNLQFFTERRMHDLRNVITHRRTVLNLTRSWRRERLARIVGLANALDERFEREGSIDDLMEIIALRRTAVQLTPPGHRERVVSLINLANSLDERFKREHNMEDLSDIISLRRAALELNPQGHQTRFVPLFNLADSLYERFRRVGDMEDLEETITHRRAVLALTPPNHRRRFVTLVNLANSLHERFVRSPTLEDLDEIITFRRAALGLTPPTSSDQWMSSLNLANSVKSIKDKVEMLI